MSQPSPKQSAAIVRSAAGFALLLWLACPVCLIAALWTSEWKWAVTGLASLLTGFAVGALIVSQKGNR